MTTPAAANNGNSPAAPDAEAPQIIMMPKEESPRWDEAALKKREQVKDDNKIRSTQADVVIKNRQISKLMQSLQDGGGLVTKRTVGEFQRGFKILAGKDLKLESFDIIGLEEGDELDVELAGTVQEALAACRDDDRDCRLLARPPWMKPEANLGENRCRRFWSRIFPCCVRKKARKWRRKLRVFDRVRTIFNTFQQSILKVLYRRRQAMKVRDFYICCQETDKEVAKLLKAFVEGCNHTAHFQLACDAVRPPPEEKTEKKPRSSSKEKAADAEAAVAAKKSEGQAAVEDKPQEDKPQEAADGAQGETTVAVAEETEAEATVAPEKVDVETMNTKRQDLIQTSRVLLVILSKETLENATVLMDCAWAWQWGVPILPVRKAPPVGLDPQSPEMADVVTVADLRKKVKFVFSLGLGMPDVGQGANRKDLRNRLTQALARSIRSGRKNKRTQLPKGLWETIGKACKKIQREAKELNSEKERNAVKATVQMKKAGLSEKATTVSRFSQFVHGTVDEVAEEGEEGVHRHSMFGRKVDDEETGSKDGSKLGSGRQSFSDGDSKDGSKLGDDIGSKEGSKLGADENEETRLKEEEEAREAFLSSALPPALEDRMYGLLAMLQSDGMQHLQVATRAAQVIRTITHSERGSIALARFGAIEVILNLAKDIAPADPKSASGQQSTRSGSPSGSPVGSPGRTSARGQDGSGRQSARGEASGRQSARGEASGRQSARGEASGRQSARGGTARDGQTARGETAREETSGRLSGRLQETKASVQAVPVKPSSNFLACFGRNAANAGDLDDSDEETEEAQGDEDGEKDEKEKKALKKEGTMAFTATTPEGTKKRLCDNLFAILRNLAAHSDQRKHEIFRLGGAIVAMQVLRAWRGSGAEDDAAACRSCVALLRNLSEGTKGCVQSLKDVGILEVAQDELEDGRGGDLVRFQILALLQNMAADLNSSGTIFEPGTAEHWLNLCNMALDKSVEEKNRRLTKIALGAVGNFALLKAADNMTAEAEFQDPEVRAEQDLRSRAAQPKTVASMMDNEEEAEEAQVKEEEDAESESEASGEASEKQSLDKEATSAGDQESDNSSATESRSEESNDEVEEEEEEHQKEDENEGAPDNDFGEALSVPTAEQEVEDSIERALKKVSGEVIQGLLKLAEVNSRRNRRMGTNSEEGDTGQSVQVAASAVAALSNFAQDTDIERFIGSLGGIELVLQSVVHAPLEDFQLQAMRFFWNMTFSKMNQQRFVDAGGIPQVVALLDTFTDPRHSRLQEQGCGVLRNLALGRTGRHRRQLLKDGSVSALCKALQRFYKDENVCTQVVSALITVCAGAPPAARQAASARGSGSLVKALKLTANNFKLTEQILQALECVLITADSLPAFCIAGGPHEVMHVFQRFYSESTAIRALRTLATALSHTTEPSSKDGGKNFGIQDLADQGQEEDPEKEFQRQQREKMRTIPCNQMRGDLMEQGAVQRVFDTMQSYGQNVEVIEAGAGLLLNLVLETSGRVKDEKHLIRKGDVGMKGDVFLRMIASVIYNPNFLVDPAIKASGAGFTATLFNLLAACAINPAPSLMLYREQAAERALEYMEAYIDAPLVQAAGCAFIGNFANAAFRIREAVLDVGTISQISELLKRYQDDSRVVEAACKALTDIATAEGASRDLRKAHTLRLCFAAMDTHVDNPKVMAAGIGLLWSMAVAPRLSQALLEEGIISRSLSILQRHMNNAKVVASVGGLLRNLLTPGTVGLRASTQFHDENGMRFILDALWMHSLPPIDEAAQAASLVAAQGRRRSMPGEPNDHQRDSQQPSTIAHQGSLQKQGTGNLLRQGTMQKGAALERQGTSQQGKLDRAGSMHGGKVSRQASMVPQAAGIDRQGSGAPGGHLAGHPGHHGPDPVAKVEKPKRVADWKPSQDSTIVGESLFATLRNACMNSEVAKQIADAIVQSNELEELLMVIELHPKSTMLQYQGFDLVNRILGVRRDLKPQMARFAEHVLMMAQRHRKTPVSDIADLVMEAIN